ncbi:hypothetical protein FISHEDRAFT_62198 [Fistulina hepatica ATCC 64428]|nr:hypothetical protein FISHEDRAFT_62198 [Fistulina hepatica ATCC 64428]
MLPQLQLAISEIGRNGTGVDGEYCRRLPPAVRTRIQTYGKVYAPATASGIPHKVLLFVLGGDFFTYEKAWRRTLVFANLGCYVARRDIVTVVYDCLLVPKVKYPEGADDVPATRECVLAHIISPEYGRGDPQKVVIATHSVGAVHLATNSLRIVCEQLCNYGWKTGTSMTETSHLLRLSRALLSSLFLVPLVVGVIFLSLTLVFDPNNPRIPKMMKEYLGTRVRNDVRAMSLHRPRRVAPSHLASPQLQCPAVHDPDKWFCCRFPYRVAVGVGAQLPASQSRLTVTVMSGLGNVPSPPALESSHRDTPVGARSSVRGSSTNEHSDAKVKPLSRVDERTSSSLRGEQVQRRNQLRNVFIAQNLARMDFSAAEPTARNRGQPPTPPAQTSKRFGGLKSWFKSAKYFSLLFFPNKVATSQERFTVDKARVFKLVQVPVHTPTQQLAHDMYSTAVYSKLWLYTWARTSRALSQSSCCPSGSLRWESRLEHDMCTAQKPSHKPINSEYCRRHQCQVYRRPPSKKNAKRVAASQPITGLFLISSRSSVSTCQKIFPCSIFQVANDNLIAAEAVSGSCARIYLYLHEHVTGSVRGMGASGGRVDARVGKTSLRASASLRALNVHLPALGSLLHLSAHFISGTSVCGNAKLSRRVVCRATSGHGAVIARPRLARDRLSRAYCNEDYTYESQQGLYTCRNEDVQGRTRTRLTNDFVFDSRAQECPVI